MENTVNERIESVVKALNITANAFAQELNVAGSVIYNIIKGRNKPSFDILDKIVSSFNVNPTYLLTGSGSIFSSNDENVQVEIQKTGDSDEDYMHFLKQWDKVKRIISINGKEEIHSYYAGVNSVLSEISTVVDHYSLMHQSIAFLRFAPKDINKNSLSKQVLKMLEFEEELSNIIKPHEQTLAKLYKEIEAFNEKHDNVNHFDDDYFENLLKDS